MQLIQRDRGNSGGARDRALPRMNMADKDDTEGAKTHALADHQYGEALTHQHDADSDHDHDEFENDGPLEENPLWIQDHVTLTSVGIDIGSSGTQVIFSKINLRR